MALTIVKKKATAKVADLHDSQADDIASMQPVLPEVVQEYLDLAAKLEKHDAKVAADRKRYADLHKQIGAVVDEVSDPEADVTLVGTSPKGKKVEVSRRASQTVITDMEQAKIELGVETFMAVAKIGIGDLRAYLTPKQLEKVTETGLTGSRRVKITD